MILITGVMRAAMHFMDHKLNSYKPITVMISRILEFWRGTDHHERNEFTRSNHRAHYEHDGGCDDLGKIIPFTPFLITGVMMRGKTFRGMVTSVTKPVVDEITRVC